MSLFRRNLGVLVCARTMYQHRSSFSSVLKDNFSAAAARSRYGSHQWCSEDEAYGSRGKRYSRDEEGEEKRPDRSQVPELSR